MIYMHIDTVHLKSGLIRGESFGDSDLIRGGLQYLNEE